MLVLNIIDNETLAYPVCNEKHETMEEAIESAQDYFDFLAKRGEEGTDPSNFEVSIKPEEL